MIRGKRNTTLLGIAFLIFLPALGGSDVAHDAVETGNGHYAAGRYDQAAEHYALAASSRPEAAEIRFNQGNVRYRQRDYDAALEAYGRALQTTNPRVEGRAKYNLGIVKHHQALEAMQTFQDALTPLRAAMTYYRGSLELDRADADARYNLELAKRLMHELEQQKVQGQRNAVTRNQKISDNKGQAFEEQGNQESGRPDGRADSGQQPQGRQADQAPQDNVSTDNQVQLQQASAPSEMSPDAAEELVEILRQRARAADSQRQEWRRSRVRNGAVEKVW